MEHRVPTVAVRVSAGDKTFAFSADTLPCDDVIACAKNTDLFLCDALCADLDGEEAAACALARHACHGGERGRRDGIPAQARALLPARTSPASVIPPTSLPKRKRISLKRGDSPAGGMATATASKSRGLCGSEVLHSAIEFVFCKKPTRLWRATLLAHLVGRPQARPLQNSSELKRKVKAAFLQF